MLPKWYLLLTLVAVAVTGIPLKEKRVFHGRALNEENYRLPTNVIPEKYNIKLIPKLSDDFVFDGEVTIRITVLEKTNNITFHVNDIEINRETVVVTRVKTGATVDITHHSHSEVTDLYVLTLKHELHKDEQYDVYIKYKGHHRDDSGGFYRSWYENDNGEIVWLVTTDFQPLNARRAFPCFDEPGLKAKFQISIARERHLHSVANMPLSKTEFSHELNLFWDIFRETPMPMSTYLVAFAVSDFKATTDGRVSILHQPNTASQAHYSARFSTAALNYLENFTSIPYFLPKMDEIAVPDYFWGAMENWALCVYKERYLLFEENVSTSANRQDIATIIFHEFAHQWFGDLVSPKWWSYLWLNEGFATYFEYLGTAGLEPQWRLDEQFVVQQLHSALSYDVSPYTHPMTVEVNTSLDIEEIFDSISYNKAGSVIRMMEHVVSHQTFRRGLTRYLNNRANSTADDSDLFKALQYQYQHEHPLSNVNVESVFKSWARKAGYPLITVSRDYKNGTVTIRQSRFSESGSAEDNSTWWVPLTYATQSNQNFHNTQVKEWLADNESEKEFHFGVNPNDWIILNVQQTGFYRVNYDAKNWAMITYYLTSGNFTTIHPINRAQLLNDMFSLAEANIIGYGYALDLTNYLSKETDYIAWYAAYDGFSYIISKLRGSEDYILLQNHLLHKIDTVYNTLGFEEKKSDDHITKLNRNQILSLACRLGHKNCIADAVQKFDAFLKDPVNNRVEPDLQSVVYCVGLQHRGEAEWNFLWHRFLNSKVSTEKYLLLRALGCAGNDAVAHNYLKKTISDNPQIREQDISVVLSSVINNGNGSDYVINFIIKYYEDIKIYGGVSKVASLIQSVATAITSQAQYNKLKDFIDEKETELGRNADSLLKSAKDNFQWQETYGTIIFKWIQQQNIIFPNGTNIIL